MLLGAVGRGHRARGGIGGVADQLFNDVIAREGIRREDVRERCVFAGLLDHELGAASVENERDAPALGVMQHAQRLRKLRAGGVLVAGGQDAQIRPRVKNVGPIDKQVFFKSHGASLPRAGKLDKPSLRQGYGKRKEWVAKAGNELAIGPTLVITAPRPSR